MRPSTEGTLVINAISGLMSTIGGGILQLFKVRQERKRAKTEALVELEKIKLGNTQELKMTDHQIDVIRTSLMGESWKDEWFALLFGMPYLTLFIGAILAATGSPALLDGTIGFIRAFDENSSVSYGELLAAIVMASMGLRLVK